MRSRRSMLENLVDPFLAVALLLAAGVSGCQPLESKTPDAEAKADPSGENPAAAAAAASEPHQAAKQAARSSARSWLALIDQSQYGDSWDAAAPVFQTSLTKEQWESAVKGARSPLGELESRQFRAAEYKDAIPGAPAGEYVVVYYDSAFGDKPAAVESVTLKKTADDSWKAAGYFIQ